MPRVLIVDDEAAICWALRSMAEGAGHEALVAATARRGLELFRESRPDAVFLDVRLPDGDGVETLAVMRRERPDAQVVVITGHGGLETAVRAMQAGAADYLVKPLDLTGARSALARALAGSAAPPSSPAHPEHAGAGGARASKDRPEPEAGRESKDAILVGRSAAMQEVGKRIGAVAATDVSVLVQGESGTGKELIARAIHAASARRAGPFEPIDCAALPPELVESELYGHEKGAFTGALKDREGRIRRAHGGTVFLDEIGELPLPTQAKLLRFLAERDLSPVGGGARVSVDVRVIAATNRPLERAVKDGLFREDLFYRLNVFAIHAPPLRERKEDIPDLVRRFLARQGRGPGAPVPPGPLEPTVEALAALRRHDWPGNVRELRNAVEHAVVIARGSALLPEHLPAYLQADAPATRGVFGAATTGGSPAPLAHQNGREGPWEAPGATRASQGHPDHLELAGRLLDAGIASGAPAAKFALERLERALAQVAYARSGGSISAAARLLGATRGTVRKWLKDSGIEAAGETRESGE